MGALFDAELQTHEFVVWPLLYVLLAVAAFFVAEFFRKHVFLAFYIYFLLFLGLLPINIIYKDSFFMTIKFIIVNVPYLLILLSLIATIPSSSVQSVRSSGNCYKLNAWLHKICAKLFKFSVEQSEQQDYHGTAGWFSWIIWFFFIANMLVAVMDEVSAARSTGNYYTIGNSLCGIVLCLPLNFPIPLQRVRVSDHSEYYLFVSSEMNAFEFRLDSLSLLWIIAYTSWDACFLFGDYNTLYVLAVAILHLGVPLCRSLIHRRYDLWLHWRAYALGVTLFLMLINELDKVLVNEATIIDAQRTGSKLAFCVWGSINCLAAVISFVLQMVAFCRKKTKQNLDEANATEHGNESIVAVES
eukprot:CAMPEP_0197030174 /NCGR_PEP_ID=MMETSP1384-20130603/9460_1 /TAXON_ID=29189 /ORGANISM="Ammonia sp." /LENGTH=356 /DNA_ID=CAMNT_0042459467 /DNA_START=23 /DNA_END=1093 /DNA_ORIENTATION=+